MKTSTKKESLQDLLTDLASFVHGNSLSHLLLFCVTKLQTNDPKPPSCREWGKLPFCQKEKTEDPRNVLNIALKRYIPCRSLAGWEDCLLHVLL